MADFTGTAGPDVFVGTDGNDSFRLEQGGDDNASGGGGNDGFFFGPALTLADIVDGGTGVDSVVIQGNYLALVLGAINNVEVLAVLPGNDTRFGDTAGNVYDYSITTADQNIAAGAILTVTAGTLRPGEDLTFNGSAETDGHFRIFAGQGLNILTGGAGNDGFFFGQDNNLTGVDRVSGGGGTDSIALRGNYFGGSAVVFENASFSNVEVVTMLSGHTNEFGGFINLNGFDYDLTMADGNTAAGQRLEIIAGTLRFNESLTFNGSAETDGSFRVIAGAGNDMITGGAGGDLLFGGGGNDVIDGGVGADQLTGQAGNDVFAFTTALGGGNVDTIADLVVGADTIRLGGQAGQPFAAMAAGALNAIAFTVGTQATTFYHRIIYDSTTGALFYDADGSGAGAAVQFATLTPGLSLTAASFEVTGGPNQLPTVTSGASATIAENSPVSTIVYQGAASDPDGDSIIWSLAGTDAASFTIDQTGAVRFVASPDFEAKATYTIEVRAHDSSGTGGAKTVTVSVTDVAEGGGSTPTIDETAGANGSIATAQAIPRASLAIADNANLANDALPSATILGSVANFSDKDYFSITLEAGEQLILDVDDPNNQGGNLDAMVRIFDANGNELAFNDDLGVLDPGSPPHPEYGHNTDSFLKWRAPAAGTYYFSIEAFQDQANPTFGSYQLQVSVGPPATEEELLQEDVEALISGSEWPTLNLTYSFPDSADDYPGQPAADLSGLQQFNPAQQAAVTGMLQHIAQVSALTFQLVAPGPATLQYAMNGQSGAAYAYYPSLSPAGGTAWFNTTSFNNPIKGGYAWMGILHETGHALGLKHGHESPAVSPAHDSLEYTVMTYRSYVGGDTTGYDNETWGYPQSLMMLDIAALQQIYGANYAFNSGNTTYQWSPTTGELSINGVGQGAPGGNRVFMTIWDGGGIDTYDLSNYSAGVQIDLRPGQWSRTSPVQLADLGGDFDPIYARGNVANALMFNDNPASLIENAIGAGGTDVITANRAANVLTGNGGADTFRWMDAGDAGTGALADTIADFVSGLDTIDLSNVDAVPATQGNDGFTFLGTGAFTGVAGQLRYQDEGANLKIQADLDGNGVSDFEIVLANTDTLLMTDFIL